MQPNGKPSIQPSDQPSVQPNGYPSPQPTLQPSMQVFYYMDTSVHFRIINTIFRLSLLLRIQMCMYVYVVNFGSTDCEPIATAFQ